MNKKGQPRHGGKPLGWRKPEGTRKQRQLRAYDDEWQIINDFARIVKRGDKQAAADFVKTHSTRVESDSIAIESSTT